MKVTTRSPLQPTSRVRAFPVLSFSIKDDVEEGDRGTMAPHNLSFPFALSFGSNSNPESSDRRKAVLTRFNAQKPKTEYNLSCQSNLMFTLAIPTFKRNK